MPFWSLLSRSARKGLLCLLALSVPARADFIWGVNGHPFTAYPGISFAEQLDLVQDLGMTSYRVNISALDRADELAELLEEAKARDIDILPVITPPFDLEAETAGSLYDKSYDMAVALVSRFREDVRVWELGNEMENYAIITACEIRDDGTQYDCSWGPAGGDAASHYFTPRWAKVSAVLRGLSDGTTSVDPTIRKAMGTAGWGHVGAFDRMLEDGIKWDISVWHHYGDDLEWALEYLRKLERPIWVTEFNQSSEQGEAHQADGLLALMTSLQRHREEYDIEAAHIYELLDEPYWAPSFEAVMGLVRQRPTNNGSWALDGPKQAYDVARKVIANDLRSSVPGARGTGTDPAHDVRRHCGVDDIDISTVNPANQVAYAYCLLLRRLPNPAEQWKYVVAMGSEGATALAMVTWILDFPEFSRSHFPAAIENDGYVNALYRLLLGRAADDGGLSGYVSRMEGGTLTREQLRAELVHSDEFGARHPILVVPQEHGRQPN